MKTVCSNTTTNLKNNNSRNSCQKIFKSDEVKNLKQLFKRENNVYQKGLQSKSKSWMIYVTAASFILFFSIFSLVDFKKNSQEL